MRRSLNSLTVERNRLPHPLREWRGCRPTPWPDADKSASDFVAHPIPLPAAFRASNVLDVAGQWELLWSKADPSKRVP